jgi:phage baseplate assembly protein W
MSPAGGAGWLFKGAELGGARSELSPPEGVVLTPAGRVAMVSGDAAIRQAIILLLTTLPGERVMRPDYGCPLNRLMFLPNDATTAGLAIHYVRQALTRFEPRIEIVALDAAAVPPGDDPRRVVDDGARLNVTLVYRVRASHRLASLDFEVGLEGGGAR